jgi:transcriptional regulator with XRE-family HTH domain
MTKFELQIRALITLSGISYKQLSKESGVDQSQIGKFMSGKRGLTLDTVGKIMDVLGCSLSPNVKIFSKRPVGRPKKLVFDRICMEAEPLDIEVHQGADSTRGAHTRSAPSTSDSIPRRARSTG